MQRTPDLLLITNTQILNAHRRANRGPSKVDALENDYEDRMSPYRQGSLLGRNVTISPGDREFTSTTVPVHRWRRGQEALPGQTCRGERRTTARDKLCRTT